jgi:hypothetical protein
MVSSILKNEPANWDVGYVLEQSMKLIKFSYRFHLLITISAYTNYIDNLLVNCKFFSFILLKLTF